MFRFAVLSAGYARLSRHSRSHGIPQLEGYPVAGVTLLFSLFSFEKDRRRPRAFSRASRTRAVRSVGESVLERLIRRAKIGYRSGASRRDNPVAATIERTLFAEGIGQRLSTYVFCRTPCWVLNVPRASLRNSLFRRVSPVAERERERGG